MKIFLIRHGQTTGDLEDRYGGDYEDHLTNQGKEQSAKLAEELVDKNIEIIYHSPRWRARETAKIIHERLGVPTKIIEDIRERNAYGIVTGMTKEQALKFFPEVVKQLEKDKLNHDVENSESYMAFKARVLPKLNQLMKKDHKVIAIVTHGGPISAFTRETLNLGEFKLLGDCACLELEFKNDLLKLLSLKNAILEKKFKK